MITCALVPEIPNDETAPRRMPRASQARDSRSSRTAPLSHSTWAEGESLCSDGGRMPWRIASTTLMTPATPAAAWVWPTLDLIDPQPTRAGRRAALAIGVEQRLGFDRVAESSRRAVPLDEVDIRGAQAGGGEGGVDDPLL